VTVPAGTFKSWKVEIAPVEGGPGSATAWIDTASRKVVKTSATQGPTTAVTELVSSR
jgi:hypothetical protein